MAKKSKRRGDAATEAPEKETDDREPTAAGADSGALRKSRRGRRGGEAADAEKVVAVAERDAAPVADAATAAVAPDSGEGRKPKLKKRKNSKQEQSSCAASDADAITGKGCPDVEGAPRDAEVSASPRFAEDASCPEGNLVEMGAPKGKKPKLKKRKKSKQERSPSAVSDDGAVVADGSGNGCKNGEGATGDYEDIIIARHGEDPDCPEVNIADKGTPDRKKPKLKKRKKSRGERSPSALASGKSGNDCTDEEGAPGDCEANMSSRNGGDLDCPQVNIAEMGTLERKKTKLKKQRKIKQERSPSAVPDDGAVDADKSGNICMDGEGASGDAEVSLSPVNREDPDRLEVNIREQGTQERKKPKLKKQKKNKKEPSPSSALDAIAVAADESGNDRIDGQGASGDAEVTLSPINREDPDCLEVNIREQGTQERKKPKLKKRKKNKKEPSPSSALDAGAVAADESGNDCTDGQCASGDAEVILSPINRREDPDCLEVNIREQGTQERKKPKLKKREKNKKEPSPSSALDAGAVAADESGNDCTDGQGASGDAEVTLSPINREDPDCLEVNIREQGTQERKKPKLKKREKNKKEPSPSSALDAGAVVADESGNDCTDGQGASGDAEVTLSPINREDPDRLEVNIREQGTQERKKPKLKKREKNKKEPSPSSALDAGAVAADESGNDCPNEKGASGDAEVSMSPRNGGDTDRPEVNIGEKGTPEMKKPKLKKQKKNKQERSPSAVSDASDVVADKSGYGNTNVEAASRDADVIMSPRGGVDPNCPEVNIAEDFMEGNKDNFQQSKPKKWKKNKQEQSPSAVSDTGAVLTDRSGNSSTNEEVTPGDADVSTSPRNRNDPNIPNAPEDSVEEKQGNEDNSQRPKQKKQKKKRKIYQVNVTEAPVVDVPCTGLIGKMDGENQPDLSEDKKIKKSMGPSICESKVTGNNVSLTLVQGTETNAKAKAVCLRASSDKSDFILNASTSGGNHNEKVQDIYSPRGSLVRFQRKKLLILDLNGLLADINQEHRNAHLAHAKVRGKLVFKRPYYDDFLRFCFQNFELGIWSSRMKTNVDSVVDILMKDLKQHLLFCWDLSQCTTTGSNTLENPYKPLVLKELKKLWNKEQPDLPWEQGEFSPSNTLLVDDSPYKALRNPPHTAIFPHPYSYWNKKDDSLGPGGDLRVYLENLAAADDVQSYVRDHPFGQPSIAAGDPNWYFYVRVLDKLKKRAA